jgi:hypothetical protein
MSLKRLDAGLAGKASAALDKIRRDAGGSPPPEVITRLKGLPAMLRTSGLPATMAFLYAKSGEDKPIEVAYRTVRDALLAEVAAVWNWGDDRPDALEFFARIGNPASLNADDLAQASMHLEGFANWLRRLAEAVERTMANPPRARASDPASRRREDNDA